MNNQPLILPRRRRKLQSVAMVASEDESRPRNQIELNTLMNCLPFRPDIRHKQKGSSTDLRTGLCLTRIDKLNC